MRSLLASLLLVVPFCAASAEGGSPLARYQGNARVLVLSAPTVADAGLAGQMRALDARRDDATVRDLVVVRAVGMQARDDQGITLDAVAVRAVLRLPADRFAAVLIGKDGGVKLRSDTPVAPRDLFGTIDAMPMRRDEMRKSR